MNNTRLMLYNSVTNFDKTYFEKNDGTKLSFKLKNRTPKKVQFCPSKDCGDNYVELKYDTSNHLIYASNGSTTWYLNNNFTLDTNINNASKFVREQ